MINLCQQCHKPIGEGDRISVNVIATYHLLKSTVAYALDRADMIADPDTIVHEDCL